MAKKIIISLVLVCFLSVSVSFLLGIFIGEHTIYFTEKYKELYGKTYKYAVLLEENKKIHCKEGEINNCLELIIYTVWIPPKFDITYINKDWFKNCKDEEVM